MSVAMMICFYLLSLEYCTDLLVIKEKELALIQENHDKYFLTWVFDRQVASFVYLLISLSSFFVFFHVN